MENNQIAFEFLPQEILEIILSYDSISAQDVLALSLCCKALRTVFFSNDLWHRKFRQRWPGLIMHYDKTVKYDWRQEFRDCITCAQTLHKIVKKVSSQVYGQDDEPSIEVYLQFENISEHRLAYFVCMDQLKKIVNQGNHMSYLTDKFYSLKVIRHLKHEHLKKEWQNFLSEPQELQLLEKGAVLITQWCELLDESTFSSIALILNHMAEQVQTEIKHSFPRHPLATFKIETPTKNLEKSLWSPSDCQCILLSLNDIMFHHLKFVGNRDDYYNPFNSYINRVIQGRTGIPITLCLIYSAVAQRLGVACLPVSFPGHFLLKWQEFPWANLDSQYSYIDVFEGGTFLNEENCRTLLPGHYETSVDSFRTATPIQVFHRMCWNLVEVGRQQERVGDGVVFLKGILELLCVLKPPGVEHLLLLARVYLHLNINLTQVLSILLEIEELDPASRQITAYMARSARGQIEAQKAKLNRKAKIVQKLRSKHPRVEYAVGMIMSHKKYNYRCVICGWDPKCMASRDWIVQMGVYNLPNKDEQPFYNVLVEDGSIRYAAQENLSMAVDLKPVLHSELGKHFQHYKEMYFEPNDEKTKQYPEDEAAREALLRKAYRQGEASGPMDKPVSDEYDYDPWNKTPYTYPNRSGVEENEQIPVDSAEDNEQPEVNEDP